MTTLSNEQTPVIGAGRRTQRSLGRGQTGRLVTYAVLAMIGWFYLFPFWWMLAGSLKTHSEFFSAPLSLRPADPQWGNYVDAWTRANFSVYLGNTVFVVFCVVMGVILFASMAAYALARSEFPGKRLIQVIIVVTIFLPAGYTIIPVYEIMLSLRLTNTIWALVIMGIAGGVTFSTFLYWGYFATLPRELEEAAVMDGANFWQVFWSVMLPLAKPMTGTVALMTTLSVWNDFFTPLIFTLNKPELRTLAVGMYAFVSENSRDWTAMLAAAIITLVPIIAIFLFLQRYFVEAIAGAVK